MTDGKTDTGRDEPGADTSRKEEGASPASAGSEQAQRPVAPRPPEAPQGYIVAVVAPCQACGGMLVVPDQRIIAAASRGLMLRVQCGRCQHKNALRPAGRSDAPMVVPATKMPKGPLLR